MKDLVKIKTSYNRGNEVFLETKFNPIIIKKVET